MSRNLEDSARRRRAQRRGRLGEALALALLRLKGYRLLARGYRTPQGEIDLILRRRSLLVFVEVKSHATLERAAEALTPKQRRRIAAAASLFLQGHPQLASLRQRFDAVLLAPGRWPRVIEDAWRDSNP
jgi:putative endonuclease